MGRPSKRLAWAASLLFAVIAVPAVAWATVSGQQSLQMKVAIQPSKAGKNETSFHAHIVYKNPNSNQQPPYNSHKLILTMAPGLTIHTSAAPQCKESAVVAAKGNAATACPAKSKVGTGSAVINARPSDPNLITGTVTIYNGQDDKGYAGFPKGSPELVLYLKTSVGVNGSDIFHMAKSGDKTKLIAVVSKPKKPGVTPGSITIQKTDLTLTGSGGKPYLTNPPICHKSWPFSFTVINYFNQPSVTTHTTVSCTS